MEVPVALCCLVRSHPPGLEREVGRRETATLERNPDDPASGVC